MTVLLILSAVGWYLFVYFKKEGTEKQKQETEARFVMPDAPDFFGFEEEEPLPSVAPKTEESSIGNFDEQAHLLLMRQYANQYNYAMAQMHGARIANFLLANPERTAEWGRILLEAGKPQEAVVVLQKIAMEDVVKTEVAIDMAFAMLRSGNASGAAEFLDEKIKNSNDLDLLAAKASITGNEQLFLRSLKGNSPNANYEYGRFLMERGDYKKSKTYLERALKAKPNEPRYIARLGMAEFYLGKDSNAEALYIRALKINPYDHNTWHNLGELYLSLANESSNPQNTRQKTRRALEAYMKSVEIDSLHARANYRIGLILNGNGQHKEAIKHLNIALDKMPNDISAMQQLSSAHLKIGDTATATNYLETILKIDPFDKIAASEFRRLSGQ